VLIIFAFNIITAEVRTIEKKIIIVLRYWDPVAQRTLNAIEIKVISKTSQGTTFNSTEIYTENSLGAHIIAKQSIVNLNIM